MNNPRYAAIDIGSNAVRLLIKELKPGFEPAGHYLNKVLLLRVPLRLGFDVFTSGYVSDVKARNVRRLMKSFRFLMKIYEVSHYRACATSAMRDAANGADIIKRIKHDTGIKIDIISGREEAMLIFNNYLEGSADRAGNFIYVDVGGGSTEINLLSDGQLLHSFSYDIGTVRMLSGAVGDDIRQRMDNDLRRLTAEYEHVNIIGSGGNINKLYRLAGKAGKKNGRLSLDALQQIYDRLLPLTAEQRQLRYGLKEDRADVIVPAAEIFLRVARIVKAEYIHVPVVGLADGIIDSLLGGDCLLSRAGAPLRNGENV
ncbi:MAG: Ppx/GppA family phosphatase [Prevotella sp.]|nr:Ppx/GppA family phosphatase [Prevotella sp.]